ncbi:hypothetical protein SSOG_05949 [Streptomyces himastatinicus ATCC 53653]|uniref:Uncharacterized protein n=1 Tax=Streptomyces himastatinicus ATCC 53653 TaxID=457427 RepID=D9WT14_9ACTN|nr:hypothetical protein [Streptomyces himastatinicus]EFL26235.1 hypothetical protein SSOG_05949 [Streptomyces himastatinicus ATCC 53653]
MRSVTHHITATSEDGTVFEVSYGYGRGQRRLLGCLHCDWQEQITYGGARHKGLDHLAQAHGALGSPRMTADAAARRQALLIMFACFAVAAVMLWWAATKG